MALLAAALMSTAAMTEPMPVLRGETLAGARLSIPKDLPEIATVFVIGFSKEARTETESWSRQLRESLPVDEVALYGVSVIEDVPRLLRGFVLRGIRSSVPEVLHDQFLIATDRGSAWQRIAGYADADTAYVVVMASDREIVWRGHGPVSDTALRELLERLEFRKESSATASGTD